jgi:hypothetical protein
MSKVLIFMIASVIAVQLIAAEPATKKPTPKEVRSLDVRDENHAYYDVVVSDLAFGANGTTRVTFSKLSSSDSQGRHSPAQGTLVWEYRGARPVPVVKGMHGSVTIDKSGQISEVSADVQVIAYRKKDADELQIIVKPEGAPYMYLRPHWIGTLEFERAVTLDWSDRYGIMLTVFAAGPGEMESELAISKTNAVPVGNSKSFKFSPGREGWKLLSPKSQRLTIPEAQKIWAAG